MFDAVPQTTNVVPLKRLSCGTDRIRFDRVYRHRETTTVGNLDGAIASRRIVDKAYHLCESALSSHAPALIFHRRIQNSIPRFQTP